MGKVRDVWEAIRTFSEGVRVEMLPLSEPRNLEVE